LISNFTFGFGFWFCFACIFVQICSGVPLYFSYRTCPIGVRHIHDRVLNEIIQQIPIHLRNNYTPQLTSTFICDIIARICSFAPLTEGQTETDNNENKRNSTSYSIMLPDLIDDRINVDVRSPPLSITLPATIRTSACEVLFGDNVEQYNVANTILDAMEKVTYNKHEI